MTTENQALIKSEAALEEWILIQLGAPAIQPKITCEQLASAIESAKRWFAAKKGAKRTKLIPVTANINTYDLDEDVDVVLDVVPTANKLDFSLLMSPFTFFDQQLIPQSVFGAGQSGGMYSTLIQAMQATETAKRIIGAEFEWRQEAKILYIFPVPSTSSNMLMFYKTSYFELKDLSERDHGMVKRYALALSMQIIGMTLGQYSGDFPGSQNAIRANYEMYLSRSDQLIKDLEVEIMNTALPLPFVMG